MLWSFDIAPALDEAGNPLLPDPDAFKSNLTARPAPFNFRLTTRNSEAGKAVLAEVIQSEDALKEWE